MFWQVVGLGFNSTVYYRELLLGSIHKAVEILLTLLLKDTKSELVLVADYKHFNCTQKRQEFSLSHLNLFSLAVRSPLRSS